MLIANGISQPTFLPCLVMFDLSCPTVTKETYTEPCKRENIVKQTKKQTQLYSPST